MPRAIVVVVTYNSYRTIDACLASLKDALGEEFTAATLVIDNGSTDETVSRIREAFGGVELVAGSENAGFGAGCNAGIRKAAAHGAEFVYLLNPDARVTVGFLAEAMGVMDQSENISAVQSLILLEPGGEKIDSAGNVTHFLGFGYCARHGQPRGRQADSAQEIPFASGAAVLLRLSALARTGGFQEEMFLYGEDLDLSWRLRLAGFQIRLATSSVVLHLHEFHRNPEKYYLLERNRWMVVFRNYSAGTLALLAPIFLLTELALVAISIREGWFRQKVRAAAWHLRGSSMRFLVRSRRQIQQTRRVTDGVATRGFTGRMEIEGEETWLLRRVANPALAAAWRVLASHI